MKLSFSYMNSIGSFLSVSTAATLLLSHPIGAIAKTPQNFAQIAVPIPLQRESLVRNTSEGRVEKGCTDILHVCREGDVLVSSSKTPPSAPLPQKSGGSR